MAVSLIQVQQAIAALAIPPLKRIYTSVDVPNEMFSRLCPALIPDPDTPLLDSNSTRQTLGNSPLAGWRRTRTIAYVCLTAEVGEARGAFTHGQRTADCWDAIENALCDFVMDGLHDVKPVVLAGKFPVNDHSGKLFFGFTVKMTYLTSY
jgi:hypothetical protein